MGQTKHRSVRVKTDVDEVEQAMQIKLRRASKKAAHFDIDIDDEFIDTGYENYVDDVEYFLRKYK